MAHSYKPRSRTTRIILHDSHTFPDKSDMKAFLAVTGRKMGLLEIGYHFLILQDGRLVECRPHDTQGSHVRGKANRDSIGVCLAGGLSPTEVCTRCGEFAISQRETCALALCNFVHPPEDNFTGAQWETLRNLRAYLQEFYGVLPVLRHSDIHAYHSRSCPPITPEKLSSCLNMS